MKLVCPDCGRQYESGKFCQECGGKLQEVTPELVCPSCGYKAKSGKFCPECGTKLTEQIAPVEETSNPKSVERTFNEKDPRFAKYYDKKGFPRTIPQEERDVAIEELTLFANQDIAEAKMLLGGILMSDAKNEDTAFKAFNLLKEAEGAGDKFAYYLIGFFYYMGAEPLLEQDHSEAEKRMLEYYKEYENGDAAQLLAELYACSTEKCDYKKAFDYATIAAEDDECGGYLVLGSLYLNGWGIEKDVNRALENYKMAAALGDETAMNQIGFIFMGDEGIDENPEQSFYWFNEAAKKGSDVGMYNLGCCYKNGYGTETDIEQAAEWFKKAAEQGYVDAMCDLGEYYQDNLVDFNKAKMWYLKAAELGNAEAQNKLGVLYADIENDYKEAIKWYKKAMEQDNPWAYRNLGICYREGNGVKKDLKKAEELFSKASELGIEDAIDIKEDMISFQEDEDINMANSLLDEGKQKEAVAIYKELAKKGNARAQGNYGNCLLNAWGVKQNLKEGIVWLEKSANQDNEWACLRLAEAYLGWDYRGKSLQYDAEKAKECLSKALSLGADPEEVNHLALMTVPSVELSNIQINKNVKEKSVLGFEVVLKMVASRMIGRKLNLSAYCIPKNGDTSCLKTPGGRKYMNPATKEVTRSPQNCLYAEICKPRLSSTVWADYKFFIPYADILNHKAKWEETLVLIAWDQTNKKPELLACEEIPFSISCTTHTFRSNEWDFTLLSPKSKKRLVTVPKKTFSIVTTTPPKKREQSEIAKLPLNEIKKAANASYPKESLKSLAVATLKIAEVIEERLPNADVSYMVHPSEFDSSVNKEALPIHFLFKKDGTPVVAVVAVTSNGYNATHVIETADACRKNEIGYVRVFADGYYADWVQGWSTVTNGPVSQESVDFCKDWLVDKISQYL